MLVLGIFSIGLGFGIFISAPTPNFALITSAPASGAAVEYSWRAYEVDMDLYPRVRAEILRCVSTPLDPHACVGRGLTSPLCHTTIEQCAYAEAYAWDQVGRAAYLALQQLDKMSAALNASHTAWKAFARLACDVPHILYMDELPRFRNLAVADCQLRLSADRAIALRDYARKLQQ